MSLTIETLGARLDLAALIAGIATDKPEREYSDGGGLYFIARRTGVHTWRFKKNGNPPRTIGTFDQFNEIAARAVASSFRSLVLDGYSLQDRKAGVAQTADEATTSPVFEVFARTFLAEQKTFGNEKSRVSWSRSIETTLKGLHGKPLHTITTEDIEAILKPIWISQPTAASDARVRVTRIFKYAIAKVPAMKGKANPADADLLKELMPEGQAKRGDVKGSHPCLPIRLMPAFWCELRAIETIGSKMLQWTILTAVRSNKARAIKFGDVKFDHEQEVEGAKTWFIAKDKNGYDAMVPVTAMMAQLIAEVRALNAKLGFGTEDDDLMFPGIRRDGMQAACNMTVLLQSTLGYDGTSKPLATVHGTSRATFKSYCQNKTKHDDLVSEFCLHHVKGDAAWEAYARGDMWEKRLACLSDWEAYVTGEERRRAEINQLPLAA